MGYLSQFDADGNFKWMKTIGEDIIYNFISPYHMTVDQSGGIYLTGIFAGTVDFDPGPNKTMLTSVFEKGKNMTNAFVAKYDAAGNYNWAIGIGGNTRGIGGYEVAVDTADNRNNVYITGSYRGTADFDPGTGVANLVGTGGMDMFLAKYDSNGQYLWAKEMGSLANDQGNSLSIGRNGDVCVAGLIGGSVDFDPGPDTAMVHVIGLQDGFIAKYDADGNYIWAKNVGDNGTIAEVTTIGRDAMENIYLSGLFIGQSIDLDPSVSTAAVLSGGYADAFIAKYDACGNYVWGGRMGGYNATGQVINRDISVSGDGQVLLAGHFDSTADFNPGAAKEDLVPPAALNAHYVAKLSFTDTPAIVNYINVASCEESYTLNGKEYTKSGQYTQIVPGTTRCDSVIILNLEIYPAMTQPVISVDKFILSVSGSYATFQWLRNGLPITGATNNSYTVTENGEYRVVVTNEGGCTDTSEVYSIKNYTGIGDELTQADQILIYPNPVKEVVYIAAPVGTNVSVHSLDGRLLQQAVNVKQIKVSELARGVYFLKIYDIQGRLLKTEKIIK